MIIILFSRYNDNNGESSNNNDVPVYGGEQLHIASHVLSEM